MPLAARGTSALLGPLLKTRPRADGAQRPNTQGLQVLLRSGVWPKPPEQRIPPETVVTDTWGLTLGVALPSPPPHSAPCLCLSCPDSWRLAFSGPLDSPLSAWSCSLPTHQPAHHPAFLEPLSTACSQAAPGWPTAATELRAFKFKSPGSSPLPEGGRPLESRKLSHYHVHPFSQGVISWQGRDLVCSNPEAGIQDSCLEHPKLQNNEHQSWKGTASIF